MALEVNTSQAKKRAVKGEQPRARSVYFGKKLCLKDRMFFTEQLALLLETGTALHGALQALRNQTSNPALQSVIHELMDEVSTGKPFSHALSKHPAFFPATYVNLVAAAEAGGFLDRVLQELLQMDERREELRRTLVSTMSYPVFLIVFSIAVVIFILAVVFPKFAELFSSIRDQLPATTLVLMRASNLVHDHWLVLGTCLTAVLASIFWWLVTPFGRETMDRIKMRLYYVRDIYIQLYLVQSLRVMGLSLANGVSVPDTLVSCREVVANRVFQKFIGHIERSVQEGKGLAIAFTESDFIPSAVKQMVATGEETGNLPRIMSRVADYYERELNKRLTALARIVEPLMLLAMGGVVGLIVSSLILPIFKLSRVVT